MKPFFYLFAFSALCLTTSCKLESAKKAAEAAATPAAKNADLAKIAADYHEESLKLHPFQATVNGDNRYNDQFPNELTAAFRAQEKQFATKNLAAVSKINRETLNDNDRITFDIFKREMEMQLEAGQLDVWKIPFHQFWGTPQTFGQFGSGEGSQPFKTVQDYDNWLKRCAAFPAWADTAVVNFKKGIETGVVLPKSLVIKTIPQCENLKSNDPKKSLFYGPINKMPKDFSAEDKKRLTDLYTKMIVMELNPAFDRLSRFLKNDYLPKARTTSGVNAVPGGDKVYNYLVKFWTTTNKTPEEIYQTGLKEVTRIRAEMERVKTEVGFKGDLPAFFEFMKNDKQFMPFKNPKEVLDSFARIQAKIDPNLKKMFINTPKTGFEIRQTEAFRAASASAEYNQGTPDGSRPGIFYVPILDAKKFNTTSGMESLFLHEAIPGHHYQVSLQQENKDLPDFRRFSWYGAYGEGWALYTESLGKELGVYTNPYQYMGALGDEMHRAIRLVVDVALHTKNMTREEAIKYMMENEAINEQGAVAEIERYMAIPGQALSYKIGALKIWELREKYTKQLGTKFNLGNFHDEMLRHGCLPLDVLEKQLDAWAAKMALKS
jgi:uncharacterized protein (DUF885 family)